MSSNIRVNSITPSVGNSVAIGTAGGSVVFQCDTINFSGTSGVTNFTEDISVDGHTELDNVNISGIVTTFDLNVDGQTELDNLNVSGVSTFQGNVDLGDDDRLRFGDSDDLQIYHESSSSSNFISASPNFKLLTDTFRLNNAANNNNIIVADSGDGVDLYFNNSKKFETTTTGAKVTGNLEVTGVLTYEDVTNVDSVGVVTARSGINVTGGHIGVGVIPESWSNNLRAVQIGRQACVTGQTGANIIEISANAYHNSGWKYIESDTATSYYQYQGAHVFSSAPSGTADNAITFSEKLRITSAGSIGISSAIPKTDVDISQKTGAVALPQGTTAQRPTGSAPYIRKNTTNNALEYFDGTSWVEIITDYFPTGSTILG